MTIRASGNLNIQAITALTRTNLIRNGTFDDDTEWAISNPLRWRIADGVAERYATGPIDNIQQENIPLIEGNTYRVSADFTITGGALSFRLVTDLGSNALLLTASANGSVSADFVAPAGTNYILRITVGGGPASLGTVDDVTLYDITPA